MGRSYRLFGLPAFFFAAPTPGRAQISANPARRRGSGVVESTISASLVLPPLGEVLGGRLGSSVPLPGVGWVKFERGAGLEGSFWRLNPPTA